jgi:hypothetical protein
MTDTDTAPQPPNAAPAESSDAAAESASWLPSFVIGRYRPAYFLVWAFVLALLLLIAWQTASAQPETAGLMSLQGKVISRTANTATTEDNSTPLYTLTFEYDADPGKALAAQTLTWEVSPEFYTAHPEGSLITLYLDPTQPDRIILEPASDNANTTRILIGGFVLLLVLTIRIGLDIYARGQGAVAIPESP